MTKINLCTRIMTTHAACYYCGSSETSADKFIGFYDRDAEIYCCLSCKNYHYWLKHHDEDFHGLYTEFPVTITNAKNSPLKRGVAPQGDGVCL